MDFDDQLLTLIRMVLPVFGGLRTFSRKYYCELSCEVKIVPDAEQSIPALHINEECMTVLSSLGAAVDFDVYLIGGL